MKIRFFLSLAIILTSGVMGAEYLKEGPLRGLDISAYLPDEQDLLKKMNEDCFEIENYRLPKHAEPSPSCMKDGGSRYYFGAKYSILLRKSIFPPGLTGGVIKVPGYSYGYELFDVHVDQPDRQVGMHPLLSKVWFVTEEKIRKFEQETDAELQRRMPPLEKYFRLVPVDPGSGKKVESP